MSSPQKFWVGVTRAIDRTEIQNEPRFEKRAARIAHYDELHDLLAAVFRTRDRDHWLARLRAEDVPCGPLNDLAEVFDDPQVRFLGMRKELPYPGRDHVAVVGSALRFSRTPATISSAAPQLGADTEAVLRAIRD